MKFAPASQLLAVATALCAVAVLSACKTTTSERWYKGSAGQTEWEQKLDSTVRQNMDTMNALARGDDEVSYVGSAFDKKKETGDQTSLFGKKEARTKSYRTKDFAGSADEYRSDDYQFLKRQNFDAKTSSDQGSVFATGEAPDNKRRFFGRNKRARTKDFAEGSNRFETGAYDGTSGRKADGNPAIVQDQASEAGASLSVDDVRSILHGP